MQRQNLADLLADDTGNLRPEVAELLSRRPARRRLTPRLLRALLRAITMRRFFLGVALCLSILVVMNMTRPQNGNSRILYEIRGSLESLATRVNQQQVAIEKIRILDRDTRRREPAKTISSVEPFSPSSSKRRGTPLSEDPTDKAVRTASPSIQENNRPQTHVPAFCLNRPENMEKKQAEKPWRLDAPLMTGTQKRINTAYLGRGKVFGYDVNVRRGPSLRSPVIRQTNQGEKFTVISYSDGWYGIKLRDNQTGYIFGAYLLPQDFSVPSHMVGVTSKGRKLLLAEYRSDGYYKVIRPDGQTYTIDKSHVSIHR